MLEHRRLTSSVELKAFLHRTRMTILAHLREAPLTVTEVAAKLGVHPANLSRHMRILEDAGLVVRQPSSGGVEKRYTAAARSFEAAPNADARTGSFALALGMVRSDLAAAEARLERDDARVVTALLGRATVSQRHAAEFARELRAIVDRFRALDHGAEGEAYHINVSLYPGGVWEGAPGPIELKQKNEKG